MLKTLYFATRTAKGDMMDANSCWKSKVWLKKTRKRKKKKKVWRMFSITLLVEINTGAKQFPSKTNLLFAY